VLKELPVIIQRLRVRQDLRDFKGFRVPKVRHKELRVQRDQRELKDLKVLVVQVKV
jgi:hypothetical protein